MNKKEMIKQLKDTIINHLLNDSSNSGKLSKLYDRLNNIKYSEDLIILSKELIELGFEYEYNSHILENVGKAIKEELESE